MCENKIINKKKKDINYQFEKNGTYQEECFYISHGELLSGGVFPVSHDDVEEIGLPLSLVSRRGMLIDHLRQQHVEFHMQLLHTSLYALQIHPRDRRDKIADVEESGGSHQLHDHVFKLVRLGTFRDEHSPAEYDLADHIGHGVRQHLRHDHRLAEAAGVVHGSEHVAELGFPHSRPVVEGFPAEHVEVAELPEELPAGAVVGEHHVLSVVSQVGGAGVGRAVGEVEVEGFQKGPGGVRSRSHHHAARAHF